MKKILPHSIMILFALALLLFIPYQIKVPESTILNARLLPILMCILIIILSLISIIVEKIKSRLVSDRVKNSGKVSEKNYIKVLLTFIIIILWIVLAPILGFILATALIIFMSSMIAGYSKKIRAGVFSLFCSTVLYFVFISLLNVALPVFPIFFLAL